MSRHTITVRSHNACDEEATIGFDPPMQTYFLHAFMHVDGNLGIWLGGRFGEFKELDTLIATVLRWGYTLEGLTEEVIAGMAVEAARPHRPSLVERHGWPIR